MHQRLTLANRRAVLYGFERALRREVHVFAEHPRIAWQQLFNRLQWEDAPMPQVLASQLEQRCASGVEPWLRLRIPLPESSALIRTLVGHADAVTGCAFSLDGATILSVSSDRTLS